MIMMVMKLDSRIIDVETAFLFGDLDEEVYMTCKEVHEEDEALFLLHAIYGLVQASRQFWIKYVKILKKIGFEGGYPDPCLYSRRDENGVVFLAVWVDDSLLVGDRKAIDKAIQDLKNEGFTLKEDGTLDDYLSCEITMNEDMTVGWIHQPHLLTKMEKRFKELINAELQDTKCTRRSCNPEPWRTSCGQREAQDLQERSGHAPLFGQAFKTRYCKWS